MNPITLILAALSGLRLLVNNPALGGGSSVRLDEASDLLGVLIALVQEGEDGYRDLKAFAEEIERMAESGSAPSPKQWEFLRDRANAAHDRLQTVKEELLDDPDPEPELELPEPELELPEPEED